MKKFLLLAAAALVAGSMCAEDEYIYSTVKNKVANPSFEEEGWTAETPGGWTWDPWNTYKAITNLPGWTVDNEAWNGIGEMWSGEENVGDGYYRAEDDFNFVRLLGYNDNGWHNIHLSQVVKDLTPGDTYHFQFLVGVNWPEGTAWTPDPNYGFTISETDTNAEGQVIAGKLIVEQNLAQDGNYSPEQDFFPTPIYDFKAPASGEIYLDIYYGNTYGEGNKTDSKWMTVDNVAVWNEVGAGVEGVTVAEDAAVLGVYNLSGVRVADNVEALGASKGLYIVRTNKGAQKIVK